VASKRKHFARLSHTAVLYPGVPETLHRLHEHFLLAIASGAFRDEINAILERHQVRSLFRAVVAMEDVRAGKPAPDPFLQALRALGEQTAAPLSAEQCVVIEDSPHGITAAHAAGMRCVGVTTHHDSTVLAAADAIIASVAELRHEDCG
jgi:HAD superfamily hydrolase (TIGR01509 family)